MSSRLHLPARPPGLSLSAARLFWFLAQTCAAVMAQFDAARVSGVREEPQLREQDFGNYQDVSEKAREKAERESYGRFFYRFPNGGESGADVYDRLTVFEDHLVRDVDAGRFTEDTSIVIVTHGLALRVFLMRWNHWTVADYEECVLHSLAGLRARRAAHACFVLFAY